MLRRMATSCLLFCELFQQRRPVGHWGRALELPRPTPSGPGEQEGRCCWRSQSSFTQRMQAVACCQRRKDPYCIGFHPWPHALPTLTRPPRLSSRQLLQKLPDCNASFSPFFPPQLCTRRLHSPGNFTTLQDHRRAAAASRKHTWQGGKLCTMCRWHPAHALAVTTDHERDKKRGT
jgi:hypothetical protein